MTKIREVEMVYNRLVTHPDQLLHAITPYFLATASTMRASRNTFSFALRERIPAILKSASSLQLPQALQQVMVETHLDRRRFDSVGIIG